MKETTDDMLHFTALANAIQYETYLFYSLVCPLSVFYAIWREVAVGLVAACSCSFARALRSLL